MKPLKKLNTLTGVSGHFENLPNMFAKDNQTERPIKWGLTLKSLCLKEKMEAHYPFMFDPGHHLSLMVIAWDYGKIWKVLPEENSSLCEHFYIPLARRNTRRIRRGNIKLFSDQKIEGAIHLLFFIAGVNDLYKRLNFNQFVEESTLYELIKKIKNKPALTPSLNLDGAITAMTKMMSSFAEASQMYLMPLLEANFDESQINHSTVIKIGEESFEMILEFNRQ